MASQDTQRLLAAITDHGLFERLATAVLREANPRYRLLSHTGVNIEGRTVSSPVDGITFVEGAIPPHMIVVHHTTCKRSSLKKKWLHDPATTNTKGGTRHTGEPGDLVKTIKLVRDQERSMPNLRATLILTTNQEPTEALVRQVNTVANKAGLEVAIWPNSAIAHFLDHDPQGQWIRNSLLGIAQEQLSFELLQELSRRSLAYAELPDESELWIDRQLDQELENAAGRDVLFLVGESGTGKSIVCQKRLHVHIQSGGIGLIIPHRIISESLSLDQAIQGTLKLLHPPLVSGAGSVARILASERASLLLVVEDVNKLEQPAIAIERLVSWSTKWKEHTRAVNCRLICPVWKRWLTGLTDQARKQIGRLILNASHFSVDEGAKAIQRRRKHAGKRITTLQATAAATALGNDPLLIALQDSDTALEPDQVIRSYVEASLGRLAALRREFTAGEYQQGLRHFAIATLEKRSFDPSMSDVASWLKNDPGVIEILRHIAHSEEIISLGSPSSNESLIFRHDRVRDWLHADALSTLMRKDAVPEAILADPFFAEIIGEALLQPDIPISLVGQIRRSNPLALFCAIRVFGEPVNDIHNAVLESARSWLADPAALRANNKMLRWSACRLLSELDASYVISLVRCFPEEQHEWWGLCASFRNGDVAAGIELCRQHGPGVRMVGHAELIEHTCKRHDHSFVKELDEILRNSRLARGDRSGALRLAGQMGNPALAGAVKACWLIDADRQNNLADYLWAGAQCCGDRADELLNPICEAWACLSDEPNDRTSVSPRNDLASDHIRWAFQEKLPEPAIRYFIRQAQNSELRWPITYMLHGIDNPDAVEFVARELAAIDRRLEGTDSVPMFASTAANHWNRQQEKSGIGMSDTSRDRLRSLWASEENERHLRYRALRLWCSTIGKGDIPKLRAISADCDLGDTALFQRLRRGDHEAIAELTKKLPDSDTGYWWQAGRYIWSEDLTLSLEDALERRRSRAEKNWEFEDAGSSDWILSERLMELPTSTVESLLSANWDHLQYSPYYVKAALYTGAPRLVEMAGKAIAESKRPRRMLAHFSSAYGVKTKHRTGITKVTQIEVLVPYLDYLAELDILSLWEVCNSHGWYRFRQQHLDSRLGSDYPRKFTDDNRATAELSNQLNQGSSFWARLWTEQFLETGVSVDHMMDVVRIWLHRQTDTKALDMAADIVIDAGRRKHLSILRDHNFADASEATAVVANAEFAVKRRSLN